MTKARQAANLLGPPLLLRLPSHNPLILRDRQREPSIDIGETLTAYVIVAELPGVRSENLNLIYDGGFLTIDAKAPEQGFPHWHGVYRNERSKGRCFRAFALPQDADLRGRRERLHQGLLTIHLPKLKSALAIRPDLTPRSHEAQRSLPLEKPQ